MRKRLDNLTEGHIDSYASVQTAGGNFQAASYAKADRGRCENTSAYSIRIVSTATQLTMS